MKLPSSSKSSVNRNDGVEIPIALIGFATFVFGLTYIIQKGMSMCMENCKIKCKKLQSIWLSGYIPKEGI
jgi:hypothetical protein